MNTTDEDLLQVEHLNRLLHELPSLDKDAGNFAQDLTAIRKKIPEEVNPWD